jgi:hypothetical protein
MPTDAENVCLLEWIGSGRTVAKTTRSTLNGRGLPRDLKRAENANGRFVLPGKLSERRGVERRDGCERFDLLVKPFAQFIILWDDAAMTRMRFERFEASMKLSHPDPVNRPVPELSFHERSAHCIEPKVLRIVIYLVIKEGCKIVWSTAKISCAASDAVMNVSDRVNLLELHGP